MPEGQKKPSAEGLSYPQELEDGRRSGLYLLVFIVKLLFYVDFVDIQKKLSIQIYLEKNYNFEATNIFK